MEPSMSPRVTQDTISNSSKLLGDSDVVRRIFDHIDHKTTDLGDRVWKEPVANYVSQKRLDAELDLIKRRSVVFCPSLALTKTGDFVARSSAGVPLIAVRAEDGTVKVFRNACRHRGVKLADGQGCKRALVCPYHGWTYGLDGQLKNIPDSEGFPGIDADANGLVPVASAEVGGLVYVCQSHSDVGGLPADNMLGLIPDDFELIDTTDMDVDANWKIHLESSLEGYHIRSLHTKTFYPRQYDNLTVVEAFGENNRIAFPYQTIEKLRTRPQADWSTNGCLTYVYHLFPNVVVSTFPDCIQVVVLEPISPKRTRQHSYLLGRGARDNSGKPDAMRQSILEGQTFAKTGAVEDLAVVLSAQEGLSSGANDHLTFGLFESAIGRLHASLHNEIG
jgi:phenylpropionate dioxygenase-like ring-hydroxylating dioxygenase large terminal subunit